MVMTHPSLSPQGIWGILLYIMYIYTILSIFTCVFVLIENNSINFCSEHAQYTKHWDSGYSDSQNHCILLHVVLAIYMKPIISK